MWGLDQSGNDWLLYTMGADRATTLGDWAGSLVGAVWGGADQLWLSLQNNLADFVNTHAGQATVLARHSDRYPWEVIQYAIGHGRPTEA